MYHAVQYRLFFPNYVQHALPGSWWEVEGKKEKEILLIQGTPLREETWNQANDDRAYVDECLLPGCFSASQPNPMPLLPGLVSEYYGSGNFPIISASEKLCRDGILPKHSPPSPNITMPHLQPSFWSCEYLLSSQSVSSWGFQRNMNHGPYLQKVFVCLQRGMDLLEPSGEGHKADLYSVSGWGLGKAGSGGFCWLCSN